MALSGKEIPTKRNGLVGLNPSFAGWPSLGIVTIIFGLITLAS